jgi:eukaryotic-like serine/threonine-protein kinase
VTARPGPTYNGPMADDDTIVDQRLRTRLGVGGVGGKPLPELVGRVVLERYLVEDKLGAGATGSVFRGRHTRIGRPVAIKALHPQHVDEPTMIGRFHREARAVARLSHANVVAVLDVGETDDGTQLIVFELANGPTLRKLITGPLPADRIARLVKPILRGLDHAHTAGLIHRDLKPDNIIVETGDDGAEIPRIVDFGIAALSDPDDSPATKLTGTGVIVGTPLYMAPEQAKGEPFDQRVDLFALGVMVYEMLAGVPPFSGTALEIAVANISSDPPPIAQRAPGVVADPFLEAYARKLMARNLADRLATAHDALELLELADRDRDLALLRIGPIDVARALAVISLPGP